MWRRGNLMTLELWLWFFAGLLVLAGLFLPDSFIDALLPVRQPEPFDTSKAFVLFLLISVALVISSVLLVSGLRLYHGHRDPHRIEGPVPEARRDHPGRAAALALLLGVLLFVKALHNFYVHILWDSTFDPFGELWFAVTLLTAFPLALIVSPRLPGSWKYARFLFVFLIPTALIIVFIYTVRVDFRSLTDQRADRITRAIGAYHAQHGRYPHELRQLTPWQLLYVPGPVIIYGQDWCYDGGEDYYRLGYVYRDHWSSPDLIGRVYAAQGSLPDLPPACQAEVLALQARYPGFYRFSQSVISQSGIRKPHRIRRLIPASTINRAA